MDSVLIMCMVVGFTSMLFLLSEAIFWLSGASLDEEDEDYGKE